MVATRNLQLTVRKTSRSQKTLEGQLLMVKNGERTSISSRVAELDNLMPQYLGVSRAILESVIFVHQEESLWPMSEPAQLKKRFDEIFEALKYTKAIENIKLLRKKQGDELSKYKIIEQHAKDDKEKGDRAEKRSTELYDEIEDLRAQVQELGAKISEATEQCQKAWDQSEKYAKAVGDLHGKRIEAKGKEDTVEELQSCMKQKMTESDEELQSTLNSYEERMGLHRQEAGGKRKRYEDLGKLLESNRVELGAKQREEGRYQAEKDQYERDLESREQLIKETARRHGIRGFDLDITETQVREFMERISRLSRDQNNALERARRDTAEEFSKAQTILNQFKERKSTLGHGKESARQQISANDRKIDGYRVQLDTIDIDEGGKAVLESTVGDVDRRLKKAKSDAGTSNLDSQIRGFQDQERSFDDEKAKLDAELIQATKDASSSARLDHLHKELKDRQQSLNTMVGAHGTRIREVLEQQWQTDTLETEFQSVLSRRVDALRDAERQRDGSSRELEQVEFKLSTSKVELKKKRDECKDHEETVRRAIEEEPTEYLEVIKDLEKSREMLMTDNTSFQNMADYYTKAKEAFRDHEVCLLCRRTFRTEKEKSSFVSIIDKHLAKAADEATKEQLLLTETDLAQAKAAQSSYDGWLRLKDVEIPALEESIHSLESKREALLVEVEQHDAAVAVKQEEKREVDSLSKTVQTITKYHAEIGTLQAQTQELSERQKQAGLSRSLEEIQDDLKKNSDQTRAIKAKLAQSTSERDRTRIEISSLEIELRDLQGRLSSAVYQLKEKSNLVTHAEELRLQNNEQREQIKRFDSEIQTLSPQIAEAEAKCEDITHRGEERVRELQGDLTKLTNSLNQLKVAEQGINSYLDRGGAQQLARTKRDIENMREEVERIEAERLQIVREIKKAEDQLRDHEETQRTISDNLRFRQNLRALETLRAEIDALENSNAEADKDRFDQEARRWQMERIKLSSDQASLIGTLKSKDDQLKQLIQDWETDYKDAAFKYKEAHIKVETTKAAVEDLGRYGGALDKAIMKFHSLKMEEINRIIEELWKKTYQGTDVDTILIRADNETKTSTNRSYNYRVCMVKQDAEMDMRGRCSAGQKVLACIIIRLALAECFGVNCGLIALDEPTTNLDRDNIRALAQSLHEIIRVRRQQSNFQLIVITHDEEFLRYMHCADFCDVYYRVSRNDRQKSIIERQSIAEVSSLSMAKMSSLIRISIGSLTPTVLLSQTGDAHEVRLPPATPRFTVKG